MKKLDKTEKIVIALVVGAAVGVALGILFAPEKGSVIRKKLFVKSDELGQELKLKLMGLMQGIRQTGSAGIADLIEANGSSKGTDQLH